ncbi:MAG: hypothetical protein AB1750_03545 [Chloroflexota bacterium]
MNYDPLARGLRRAEPNDRIETSAGNSQPRQVVMKASLDRFILSFPVLFLKQYPYAWIAVVALWDWPPVLSGVFLAVIAIGIAALNWRAAAWISEQRRQLAPNGNGTFLVQRVPIPWAHTARGVAVLLAVAAVTAWLAGDLVGLGFWRFFIMIVGFALTYLDTRFFGAEATYVLADSGVAVYFVSGHLDYRVFLRFKEMERVQRLDAAEKIGETWWVFSRLRKAKSGILIQPRNPAGFSKQIREVFLTPTNVDEFLARIPSTLTNEL